MRNGFMIGVLPLSSFSNISQTFLKHWSNIGREFRFFSLVTDSCRMNFSLFSRAWTLAVTCSVICSVIVAATLALALTSTAFADGIATTEPSLTASVSTTTPSVGATISDTATLSYYQSGQLSEQWSAINTDGSSVALGQPATMAVTGSGQASETGSFTIPDARQYQLTINYTADGQLSPSAEATLMVTPTATLTATPIAAPTAPTPTTTAQPTPPVTITPITAAPVISQPAPTANPAGAEQASARLHLSITGPERVALGGIAHFVINLGNRSANTARKLRLCAQLPRGLAFISASRTAHFSGSLLCFALPNTAERSALQLRLLVISPWPGALTTRFRVSAGNAASVFTARTLTAIASRHYRLAQS
jgi:uncharacterized repeat protein (TIGR01451 family)